MRIPVRINVAMCIQRCWDWRWPLKCEYQSWCHQWRGRWRCTVGKRPTGVHGRWRGKVINHWPSRLDMDNMTPAEHPVNIPSWELIETVYGTEAWKIWLSIEHGLGCQDTLRSQCQNRDSSWKVVPTSTSALSAVLGFTTPGTKIKNLIHDLLSPYFESGRNIEVVC